MNLGFSQAAKDHIPIIFLQAKELIETYEDLKSIDLEKVLAWMERKITRNISEYTAVSLNGEVCAFYRLCEDGELDDLYVLPGYRSLGIGSEIINRCIRESQVPLWLYVFSSNTRAISFYERHGFSAREQVGKTRMILHRNG